MELKHEPETHTVCNIAFHPVYTLLLTPSLLSLLSPFSSPYSCPPVSTPLSPFHLVSIHSLTVHLHLRLCPYWDICPYKEIKKEIRKIKRNSKSATNFDILIFTYLVFIVFRLLSVIFISVSLFSLILFFLSWKLFFERQMILKTNHGVSNYAYELWISSYNFIFDDRTNTRMNLDSEFNDKNYI